MAHVTVRLFAALRELADSPRVEADAETVGGLVDVLSERFGARFASVASAGSVVVDGERAEPSLRLADGQEVALLPPVSGGEGGVWSTCSPPSGGRAGP